MANIDVGAYGPVGGGGDDTRAIQAALDACAASGGGRVMIPAGRVLQCAHLRLSAHLELHLEAGSVLRAIPDPALYDHRPRGHFWITADDADNIAITGTGCIDGQGRLFMKEERPEGYVSNPGCPRALGFFGCRGVRIRDITLRETADWAIHPCGCEDVVISGVTIRNNLKIPNCDGIDPDHCRHVRISDCHIESGDDGIVVKTREEWNRYGPCEHIVISNCTIISTSCGIKIGTETSQDIRNVSVSNCVVHSTNRCLGVVHRDAGTVENISFSDCILQARLFHDRWWGKGEPIHVSALPRTGDTVQGPLRRIRFSGITARAEAGVYVQGHAGCPVTGLDVRGLHLTVAPPRRWTPGLVDPRPCPPDILPRGGVAVGEPTPWGTLVRRDIPGLYLEHATDVTLDDCAVAWEGPMPVVYTHALETCQVRQLRVRDFRGDAARPGLPARLDQA